MKAIPNAGIFQVANPNLCGLMGGLFDLRLNKEPFFEQLSKLEAIH